MINANLYRLIEKINRFFDSTVSSNHAASRNKQIRLPWIWCMCIRGECIRVALLTSGKQAVRQNWLDLPVVWRLCDNCPTDAFSFKGPAFSKGCLGAQKAHGPTYPILACEAPSPLAVVSETCSL